MKVEEIGSKIRTQRKKGGLTLEQLARKVGISAITLQRIETGKSSPSVIVLDEIAAALNRPLFSFLEGGGKPFVHIKSKDQQVVSGRSLMSMFVGPRRMIADNIVVIRGQLEKGKSIDPHTNPGVEWVYGTEGTGKFTLNGEIHILEAGDSASYDARLEHSVTALETMKYFAIVVEDKE
jgi:transcriptional regulator with XRE-family HTH domain